ncbi:(2Fe-2S) ferredoxin domain-containing protein [Xanthovirga aplysinae]|uniref:(2Fe-2S) ferredoxin domain-containing protein n=1 Tax=Xanthovirga aplysinae TaxID=2529853 RepID=UPI0012BC355F|nr:(2Fe-2S) ferredoxin domain-containing protein [Xanthovirga aplysinae]MTI33644.1 (2Fe-2S) ferredoxin domain-containing protein [Xanthovirga aplysinae]
MGKNLAALDHYIQFCNGGSCKKKGAEELTQEMRANLRSQGLFHKVHTMKTLCMGRCEDAPVLIMQPDNVWYKNVCLEKGEEIIEQHVKNRNVIENHLLFKNGAHKVLSENERKGPTPAKFIKALDHDLGLVEIAQATASEQELYPMLKDLFIKFHKEISIHFSISKTDGIKLTRPAKFDYHRPFLSIQNPEFNLSLIIAPLPKTEDNKKLLPERIGNVEVFRKLNTQEKPYKWGIRMKDKKDELKLLIYCEDPSFKINQSEISCWQHFVKIYLDL